MSDLWLVAGAVAAYFFITEDPLGILTSDEAQMREDIERGRLAREVEISEYGRSVLTGALPDIERRLNRLGIPWIVKMRGDERTLMTVPVPYKSIFDGIVDDVEAAIQTV